MSHPIMNRLAALMGAALVDISVVDDGDARNTSGNSSATHTFASQTSTGPYTIVCLTSYYVGGTSHSIASATWNGNAVSVLYQASFNDGSGGSGLMAVLGIAGAQSGSLVVNFSGGATVYGSAISKLSLTGLVSPTPIDTDVNSGTSGGTRTLSALTSPGDGGVRIAVTCNRFPTSTSWTNAVEVSDYAPEVYWNISAAYDLGNDATSISAAGNNAAAGIIGVSLR